MARFSSHMTRVRSQLKGGGLFLIVAVVVFAGVVFLLFRDQSGGPQEASAGNLEQTGPPVEDTATPASVLAVETPQEEPEASPTAVPVEPAGATAVAPEPETVDPALARADAAIAEAQELIRAQPHAVIETRDKFNDVLQMPLTPQQRQTVKKAMGELSEDWLFGPATFPGDRLCDTYQVKRGDLLEIIGKRFKVPYQLLMQINRIPKPEALQAGQALKVVNGPFHAKVCRSTFTLDLYLQNTYVRSFKVGLGKPGYETPTGQWRVQEGGKLIKPRWTDPDTGRVYRASDPDYPLGSRWIALDGVSGAARGRTGFAIHGTKDPDQIGTAGSRGCIRMYNGDAILMYNVLVPLYSEVEVFD